VNTCFKLVKQAGSWSRFPRGFPRVALGTSASDATWVGSCFSGGSVWEHVVSLKTAA